METNIDFGSFAEIFIYMLGSFLIGYGFAYYYFKPKIRDLNATFGARQINEKLDEVVVGKIKAKKTFERGGLEVEENRQSKIDFFIEEEPKKQKQTAKKKSPKRT